MHHSSGIKQVLFRYAFADDEHDEAMLQDCLADDADVGGARGREQVVALHRQGWAALDGTMWRTVVTNTFLVDATETTATAMSLLLRFRVTDRLTVVEDGIGRLLDHLVLEGGGWKLQSRRAIFDVPTSGPAAPIDLTVPSSPAELFTASVHPERVAGKEPAVADYDRIVQLLFRYAYAHNERDPQLLGTCFADGARMQGTEGRDNVVAAYQALWAGQTMFDRRHVFANTFIVEQNATEAITMTNQMVWWIKDRAHAHLGGLGRYRDHVIVERGEWKILTRDVSLDIPYDPGDMQGAPAFDLPVPGLTLG